MKITPYGNAYLTIERDGGPEMPSERAFWYAFRKHIDSTAKMELIKRPMWGDQYMATGTAYYLKNKADRYCIHYANYVVRNVIEPYNEGEDFKLTIVPADYGAPATFPTFLDS